MEPIPRGKYLGIPYGLSSAYNLALLSRETKLINFLLRIKMSGLTKKSKKEVFHFYQKSEHSAANFPTGKKVKWRDRNKRLRNARYIRKNVKD